jgi:hypothetical protein
MRIAAEFAAETQDRIAWEKSDSIQKVSDQSRTFCPQFSLD